MWDYKLCNRFAQATLNECSAGVTQPVSMSAKAEICPYVVEQLSDADQPFARQLRGMATAVNCVWASRKSTQKRASRSDITIELPSSLWESVMKTEQTRAAWNKGKLVGQKPPLKLKDVWAIRIYLQNAHAVRDLALFNLAIDSKLRGCDLVSLRVRDVTHGNQVLSRAQVIQRKTQRPVQFELTEPTRKAVGAWLEKVVLRAGSVSLSQSAVRIASSLHPTICSDDTSMGGCGGT